MYDLVFTLTDPQYDLEDSDIQNYVKGSFGQSLQKKACIVVS